MLIEREDRDKKPEGRIQHTIVMWDSFNGKDTTLYELARRINRGNSMKLDEFKKFRCPSRNPSDCWKRKENKKCKQKCARYKSNCIGSYLFAFDVDVPDADLKLSLQKIRAMGLIPNIAYKTYSFSERVRKHRIICKTNEMIDRETLDELYSTIKRIDKDNYFDVMALSSGRMLYAGTQATVLNEQLNTLKSVKRLIRCNPAPVKRKSYVETTIEFKGNSSIYEYINNMMRLWDEEKIDYSKFYNECFCLCITLKLEHNLPQYVEYMLSIYDNSIHSKDLEYYTSWFVEQHNLGYHSYRSAAAYRKIRELAS